MNEPENIKEKHREMVLRLSKPGAAILKEMTPFDAHLTHMGGCLMGEAEELDEALSTDDIIEELGDFEFYHVAVCEIFGCDPELVIHQKLEERKDLCSSRYMLLKLGGRIWDVIKRIVVYRRDPEAINPNTNESLNQAAERLLGNMRAELNDLYGAYNLRREDILQANWTKLADKDKGRYASGTYSNEQAQARRDKEPVRCAGDGQK